MRFLIAILLMSKIAFAEGERAGDFDYYVLSLSWSPNWCALEGRARNSEQCDEDNENGWIMHGLWPQFETGWPSFCPTNARNPSRSDTAAMADIMGTSGLAWHQWNKHGRCSGLTSDAYFELSRKAYEQVVRPAILRDLTRRVTLPASLIEEAFLRDNPELGADMITITCKSNHIQEARICLTKDLETRVCGNDVIRDCKMTSAVFEPIN